MEEKLKEAVNLAIQLDDRVEEMMKTHEVEIDISEQASRLTVGDQLLLASPSFIEGHTVGEIIGRVFHEALHVIPLCHAKEWARIKRDLAECRTFPPDWKTETGKIQWNWLQVVWNMVCDAAINEELKHVPVIRDSDGVMFGKKPLSTIQVMDVVMAFYVVVYKEIPRQEAIAFIREMGYEDEKGEG